MAIHVKKLQSTTILQSFKNNGVYTGEFIISGNMPVGGYQVVKEIVLPREVSIADILFQGRADGGFDAPTGNPRPNHAWFKSGAVNASASGGGYDNAPQQFIIGARISGRRVILTATSWRSFLGDLYIKPEPVRYKIIDYSVF